MLVHIAHYMMEGCGGMQWDATVMSWLRAWAEKRALSTANEASYHQDKQSELERSIHKPLRA